MKPAIQICDLHKHFDLSHSGVASIKTALLWFRRKRVERLEVLKGVTFNLNRGETVALVGRNGAGKSTLLSLIARVYKPSSGTIAVEGRVAPLLELGAGFHPDLTGLENIQFNGVILGLTRKELAKRVDRIVAFAELENHIDTPVRTYSSGMMARLGFAIAAHVDADIMIVDEVLAVGDYAFEEKCYQKIEEFRANGGSILFVSHNFESIYRVADRCVWMKDGVVAMEGDPRDVVAAYREADV
ncbi:MAG: ABC transporter ATP-binding protein [Fimbriimonadaceae bacterium]